jgi:hypothetical protein
VYDYAAERRKSEHETSSSFAALVKPLPLPPKQFALLYTSGRNSAAAFHACLERRLAFCAVVPFSDPDEARHERFKRGARHGGDRADVDSALNADPDRAHTKPMRAAAARFADAAAVALWNRGVPGYTQRTRYAKTRDAAVTALAKSLVRLRADYGLLGVAHGHVFDVSALCAVEEASELAGIVALAPVWRDARATQNMLASPTGAAGLLVTAGSPHAVGRVVHDARSIDTLIDSGGGAFAADGDAAGTTFDAVPSEAVFYADAAVAFVPSSGAIVADALSSSANGAGTREIQWKDVSVVRRPKPPGFVRRVGGRGWSAA